jgi:hypothetical protein
MRNLIKGMVAVTLALALTLAVTGDVLARGGHHGAYTGTASTTGTTVTTGGCAGYTNGTCPVADGGVCAVNIFTGEAVTVTGTVATVLHNGDGMGIDNGTEVVTVYGFGPYRYWEQVGVDRPEVGDAVTVKAYNVTYSDGTVRTIAASVLVGEEEVSLRDATTGAPLWRGGRGGCGGGRGYNGTCPYTAPATE